MIKYNEIETLLLVYENEFFSRNMELFEPKMNDFKRWLESLPDFVADIYRNHGFEKSIDTRDFLRFYHVEILGLSIRDFLVFKNLTNKEIEYWDKMEKERIVALNEMKKNPNIRKLFTE